MPATMTASPIKALRQSAADLVAEEKRLLEEARATHAKAANEKRALTDAEKTRDDTIAARLDAIALEQATVASRIKQETRLADIERNAPAADVAIVESVEEGWKADPKRGFESPKAMLLEVFNATRTGRVDARLSSLRIQATAGSDEHVVGNDPYGGFLIPTGLMPGVKTISPDADPLASMTTKVDMGGVRILKINARVDKDHSSSVSGGLTVYRRAEAGTGTASRTKFEQVELASNELFGVTYASEELLAASPIAFASMLSGFFSDEFGAKVFEERLNGTGAGQYQGIANSPALVTVSKETGQAADTIVFANLVNMISRCYGYGNAVWLANATCYPQLRQMVQPGSTIPIFATGTPGIASLEGRPIYFHERLAAIGDLGDLILVNPKEYLESGDGAVQSAASIHVRFLEHEQTFKFWTTNAGAGWWRTALTPKRGSTLSPFIYLAAR